MELTFKKNQFIMKKKYFQPFSFFFVSDVQINIENYTADIYLETIGKTKILEEEIKKGKEIVYNGKKNIMEAKK